MNKSLKVAFFGTSDRSIPILEALHKNYSLNLIITKTDSLFGRKKTLKETQVKTWAKENRVNFVTINKADQSWKNQVVEQLISSNVELGIVADFSFIIPKTIINTLKFGIINIHFSALPKYRGASPIQFSILNGDKESAITYYLMDEGMDTGKIIKVVPFMINSDATTQDLYNETFLLASKNLAEVISGYIRQELIPYEQPSEGISYTYSKSRPKSTLIYKDDARITKEMSARETYNAIRAFNPWPIAFLKIQDFAEFEAFNLKKYQLKHPKYKDLTVKIFEATLENNFVTPETVQVEGSNKISFKDFINGYFI